MNSSLRLTIRGIDPRTKRQLVQIAAGRGMTLDTLVVRILKQAASTSTTEERLHLMRETLHANRIAHNDIVAAEVSITELDASSKAKQLSGEV